MLIPAADGPAIVACNSCARGAGADLVAALRRVQASAPDYAGIAVEEMACLFACGQACAVHLRAPGRIGYVLGRFTPDEDAARAILDFARAHSESAIGEVAFADWPEGVKGHFLVRVPPPGYVVG